MRSIMIVLAVLSLRVFVPSHIGADTLSGSWFVYEQGNALFARGDFGQALKFYKDAIGIAGIFPEAEMGLGDVYLAEGEFNIARAQYEKAYNLRNAFYIADSKYDVLYRLAHLFENQELYKLMEDRLAAIVADDRHFTETPNSQMKTQIEKNYLQKGLDHVLELYSFSDAFAMNAHSKLGWFYYRSGRFSQAISQLLYSTISRVSQVNQYLREADIDYQFSTLQDMLAAVGQSPQLAGYVSSSDFFKDLYYLAGATFANGFPTHAIALWKLVAGQAGAGVYQEMSRKQLRKPATEPLLGVTAGGQGKNGY
jgi:tetratricopeptide (TPR) repeat protein